MTFIQFLIMHLDKTVEMLMDDGCTKTDCALYLMKFKESLLKKDSVVVDGDCTEIHDGLEICQKEA